MQGVTSTKKFQNHSLHIEFRTHINHMPLHKGAVTVVCYLQGRYEVQVLDSFGLDGKSNECGGIYSIREPDVNHVLSAVAMQT